MATKKLSKSTLRWFIGTKSLMPIVEIRRRFGINGDEVTVLEDRDGPVFVGLPQHAAQALEDLRQQGKIGYEFSADLNARVLIGTYTVHRKRGDRQMGEDIEPESDDEENAA